MNPHAAPPPPPPSTYGLLQVHHYTQFDICEQLWSASFFSLLAIGQKPDMSSECKCTRKRPIRYSGPPVVVFRDVEHCSPAELTRRNLSWGRQQLPLYHKHPRRS